jgi:hypothetical protein
MPHFPLLSPRRLLEVFAAAGFIIAPLAGLTFGQQPTSRQVFGQENVVYRSTTQWRERIPDELDRPRYKERWTHRGFEVVSDQITVVANTNVEDARRAAAEATGAWQDAAKISDHFTKVHRNRDFGIGALQVYVDGEPLRNRDQPLTTLSAVGQKNQVTVHVDKGSPTLEQQARRLREATVLAFMRTAEIDIQYPTWVSQGIAGYLAEKDGTPEELANVKPTQATANIGGQQWRQVRKEQDVLAVDPDVRTEAVARVRFLLEGDDSSHTPDFFQALQASTQELMHRRANENLVNTRRGEVQPQVASKIGDQFFTSLEKEYTAWQQDPLAGQPVYKPADNITPETEQLQREMALVLKLQRRITGPAKAPVRAKVVSFKPGVGSQVSQSSQPKVLAGVADPRDLFFDLTSGERGAWATRDVDGSLLLSSNTQRLEELFGDDGRRFKRLRHGDRWVLSYALPNGKVMAGWLEENKETPTRPDAKFEVIDPKQTVGPEVQPTKEPQAELGAPQPQAPALPADSAPPGNQPVGERGAQPVQPDQQATPRR